MANNRRTTPWQQAAAEGLTQQQIEAKLGVPPVCQGERCRGLGRRVSFEELRQQEVQDQLRESREIAQANSSVSYQRGRRI